MGKKQTAIEADLRRQLDLATKRADALQQEVAFAERTRKRQEAQEAHARDFGELEKWCAFIEESKIPDTVCLSANVVLPGDMMTGTQISNPDA